MNIIVGVNGLICLISRKFSKIFVFKVRSTIFYLFLTIFFLAFNPVHSIAADFYVAQTVSGDASGSSCTNALVSTWFNSSLNWANPKVSGKIGPGDTVHLCGTISTALDIQGSGSSGAVITILFEPGAIMSAPTWPINGAIRAFMKHYITIDGGATGVIGGPNGNPALANGIIECTDNGTSLGNQGGSIGVYGVTASHFTVKNLIVRNMYVRNRGTEKIAAGLGITNTGSNGAIVGYTVYNNIVHDAYLGINSDFNAGCDDYEISFNTVYNCNWGVVTGSRGRASDSLTNISVHDNYFHSWTNWDETDSNAFHHNAYYAWAQSGSSITSPKVYNNVIGPGFGGAYQTSGLYMSEGVEDPYFYNNVFYAGVDEYCGNGFITIGLTSATTLNVYNNTFISAGGSSRTAIQVTGRIPGQTLNIKNNLIKGAFTPIALYYKDNVTLNSDYNSFYEHTGFIYSSNGNGVFKTMEQWAAFGFDSHSITADPKVTSSTDGHLQFDSPNIDSGVSLSSYFTTDADSIIRSQELAWDIGAYEDGIAAPRNFNITSSR